MNAGTFKHQNNYKVFSLQAQNINIKTTIAFHNFNSN